MAFASAIIGGASSLMQAQSTAKAGAQTQAEANFTASELESEAKQEEVAAVQRETDRKQRLSKAMASQIVSAGARGITAFEGSPLTILESDIKTEETATQRDLFNTRLAALSKRRKGQALKEGGLIGNIMAQQSAGIGLAGDAAKFAEVI